MNDASVYKTVRQRSSILGGLVAFISTILFFIAQFFTEKLDNYWLKLVISAVLFLVFIVITLIVLRKYLLKPLEILNRAEIAVLNARLKNAPQASDKEVKKWNLASMLNIIYNSSVINQVADLSSISAVDSMKEIPYGISVLNDDGNVMWSTSSSPLKIGDNLFSLKTNENELSIIKRWLMSSRNSEENTQTNWSGVGVDVTGRGDYSIYNIFASFNHQASSEVVLLFVDKTTKALAESEQLDFIAFTAHELRGPVTVIKGYLDVLTQELIEAKKIDNEYSAVFDRLMVSANRLSSSINNILNASRYDKKHMKLNLKPQSLKKVFEVVESDLNSRAITQDKKLDVDIPEDLPDVAADRTSLSEVFANLIDNAIKYSPSGKTVCVKAEYNGHGEVSVRVVDQGIGMPTNVVDHLFKKFYRSHRSRDSVAGSGIGLYISKMIIESHGGSISVVSREGEGSTFCFTVPTYQSVKTKLEHNRNSNESLIRGELPEISNHNMRRG